MAEDLIIRGAHGHPIRLKDMGDGTYATVTSDGNGQSGVFVGKGAKTAPGPYSCVHVITETVITAWTEPGATNAGDMVGTLPPGFYFGKDISFTMSSGLVRAST